MIEYSTGTLDAIRMCCKLDSHSSYQYRSRSERMRIRMRIIWMDLATELNKDSDADTV